MRARAERRDRRSLRTRKEALQYDDPTIMNSADGRFEIRITRADADISAAQELRYRIFYEEMDAVASEQTKILRRDADTFDSICDHILVNDVTRAAGDQAVGTYRLLRHDVALAHRGFYSADEYDLSNILGRSTDNTGICEIGRSSVHADYRNNATIQLLWRGLARYFSENEITYTLGCASFPGVDPAVHALPLSYLYHHHLAREDLRARALPDRFSEMNLMPKDQIELKKALKQMPPLIKAYLRLGAFVGDGAVIDHQFHTTDVFVITDMATIPEKYHVHFEREAALQS
jgi:putative hemolysin